MAAQNSDVAVVGHFSVDTINLPTRKTPFKVLGGSATYTSFAAKRLDASVSVISKVGTTFPQAYLWWLEQEGINISTVTHHPDGPTTSFELNYSQDFTERTLKLKSKGPTITAEDLPKDFHAKAVHLAPIVSEIPYEVAEQLKGCADVVSLDPQGLLRDFDEAGNVSENAIVDNHMFSLVNIFKSSQNEIYTLTGETDLKHAIKVIHEVGVETVIVTLGAKGSVLSVGGTQYNIAAYPSQMLVDPTGAGDAFIGAFLTEYTRQKDSLWCAAVGSAQHRVVEGIGPTYFGKKKRFIEEPTFS